MTNLDQYRQQAMHLSARADRYDPAAMRAAAAAIVELAEECDRLRRYGERLACDLDDERTARRHLCDELAKATFAGEAEAAC